MYLRGKIYRTINAYGKKLIDLCKYAGLQICNGRLCDSGYTCYKYNGESVVDYLLAPPNAFTTIGNFKICDKLVYSDHCALSFSLLDKTPHLHNGKDRTKPINPQPLVYWWDPSLKQHIAGSSAAPHVWISHVKLQWPLLLTWFNFNPSMDK